MLSEQEFLATFAELRRDTLYVWIERGWLSPVRDGGAWQFREIDVARVRLIRELNEDLDLTADALDVVLPLLDQVHGLRRELRRLADAVDTQPPEIRNRILRSLGDRHP